MQPETEADEETRKWAWAGAGAGAGERLGGLLRTFSNINTLAFVFKLWPGTCVAQTGLPIPASLRPPSSA